MNDDTTETHRVVGEYYREAAKSRAIAPEEDERWGAALYDNEDLAVVETEVANLSMGCGNPYALADLEEGEIVLDLGSGGGLDVILSARRVGPSGRAYGLDFLADMNDIARKNAADAGVENVEFLHGMIEEIPLPDESVDVVISNCVLNLAPDKQPVFDEISRVLRPGGRVAVSDVVADNGHRTSPDGLDWAECGAGALEHDVYLEMLGRAGLENCTIEVTHQTEAGLNAAAIRAVRPR